MTLDFFKERPKTAINQETPPKGAAISKNCLKMKHYLLKTTDRNTDEKKNFRETEMSLHLNVLAFKWSMKMHHRNTTPLCITVIEYWSRKWLLSSSRQSSSINVIFLVQFFYKLLILGTFINIWLWVQKHFTNMKRLRRNVVVTPTDYIHQHKVMVQHHNLWHLIRSDQLKQELPPKLNKIWDCNIIAETSLWYFCTW